MRKKIYLTLLSIFIIVITASSSYAYFNGKVSIKGSNGDNLDVLNIQNGNEKINIDTSKSKWEYKGQEVNENGITNPTTGDIAAYKGVKVSNESNLTSNVELKFTFNSLKEGGSTEDEDAVPPEDNDKEDTREPAESFEVWVGDIDNLGVNGGYGQGSVEKDKEYVLSGKLPDTNGLDIFPESVEGREDRNDPDKYDGTDSNGNLTNDATGTDRRMVTSGFYNFYQKLIGNNYDNELKDKIVVHHKTNTQKYIYYWNTIDSQGNLNAKPIVDWYSSPEMKSEGDGWYSYTIENCISTNLIFNNRGNDKTGDLTITEGEWWYKDGEWYKENPDELPQIKWYSFLRTASYENKDYPLNRYDYSHKDASFYSLTYSNYILNGTSYSTDNNEFYHNNKHAIIGPTTNDNGEIFYDGYTDRALRKKYADNTDNNSEYIQNGVNWAELQPVEPITFMYQDKIGTSNGSQKKVTSATVQIMLNDIQPEPSESKWTERWNGGEWNTRFSIGSNSIKNIEWQTSYSAKSNVNYQVTLKVKDKDMTPIRVEEWEKIINNLDQHGPRANLVTLEVPQRLLYLIEEGEESGLELLIDDPRDGSTINSLTGKPDVAGGDSYCIDFARLLVNDTISDKATIEGVVKDVVTKEVIEGVKINNGNNENIATDSEGRFTISVIPGQVVLNFSHSSYIDRDYTIYNIENGGNTTIEIYMTPKDSDITIVPKLKFEGKLTISKYKKHEHTSLCNDNCNEKYILVKIDGEDYKEYQFNLGEAGTKDEKNEVFTELKIEPGHYYILDYELKLFNGEDIDKFSNDFNLIFSSDIEAKITQENNSGWEENGTQ
ncbi:starch-binding protein [Clostridium cuniculi]|uniref:starch-binding protein n=1 Tax=Clostridium cuniculi TaxID=2548455 RepID=UPI0010550265|nr:starch-binding protein [Clostridium cuniculi]